MEQDVRPIIIINFTNLPRWPWRSAPGNTEMLHSTTLFPYDPNRLLDTLAMWLGISSDLALSHTLGLSPNLLHAIRRGHLPIRPTLLMFILGERRRRVGMPRALPAR
jgi:hypothetical protein